MANGRIIKPSKIEAVIDLYGDSSYHMADVNGKVIWKDGHETTAEETTAINAKVIELEAEYDANQRDRQYPSIGDQLDMQYHDSVRGTTTWVDAVAKVKADNPKE
jgi:hypothetical protein